MNLRKELHFFLVKVSEVEKEAVRRCRLMYRFEGEKTGLLASTFPDGGWKLDESSLKKKSIGVLNTRVLNFCVTVSKVRISLTHTTYFGIVNFKCCNSFFT